MSLLVYNPSQSAAASLPRLSSISRWPSHTFQSYSLYTFSSHPAFSPSFFLLYISSLSRPIDSDLLIRLSSSLNHDHSLISRLIRHLHLFSHDYGTTVSQQCSPRPSFSRSPLLPSLPLTARSPSSPGTLVATVLPWPSRAPSSLVPAPTPRSVSLLPSHIFHPV